MLKASPVFGVPAKPIALNSPLANSSIVEIASMDVRLDHTPHGVGRTIGAGAAGLSAAWRLGEVAEVTVLEAEGRLGGHANTLDAPGPGGDTPVDTGFIVYNEDNYPNFVALLAHLAPLAKG